jgi:RsiW-degrading membrane proteinase PrsW (M82 family)
VTIVLGAATSVLPVLVFLGLLRLLDSYKLVAIRAILLSVLAGVLAALAGYAINVALLPVLGVDFSHYSRYVAPVVEETLKAAFVVYLVRQHKVGFVVDAAIHGFGIGAGFALLENLVYLSLHPGAPPWTWVVRGFGTAIMHGGTTAIVAMVSRTLLNRTDAFRLRLVVPGLGLAVVLHSVYNHFLLQPVLATAVIVLVVPVVAVVVFHQSERAARGWVGEGFDTDQELLKAVTGARVSDTPVGKYIMTLRSHFAPETIVDMMCLLRLRAELAIRVKGILLMREAGFEPPPDPAVKDKLREVRYLERSIGKTGLVALHPFLHTSARDRWQLTVLEA